MSDEALSNAFAELHSLEDRQKDVDGQIATLRELREELEAQIAKAAEFIVAWHKYADKAVPTLEAVRTAYRTPEAIMNSPAPLKVSGNPKKEAVAEATADIAVELGRPVPRPELHKLLKERGLHVRGTEPLVTLSTMLWRMKDRIIHIPGRGYWPHGVQLANTENNYVESKFDDDLPDDIIDQRDSEKSDVTERRRVV